jgi:hypothetical protein
MVKVPARQAVLSPATGFQRSCGSGGGSPFRSTARRPSASYSKETGRRTKGGYQNHPGRNWSLRTRWPKPKILRCPLASPASPNLGTIWKLFFLRRSQNALRIASGKEFGFPRKHFCFQGIGVKRERTAMKQHRITSVSHFEVKIGIHLANQLHGD